MQVEGTDAAFSEEERREFRVEGLVPTRLETIDDQRERMLKYLRDLSTPYEKFLYLQSIKHNNVTAFYNIVINNLVELLPIVYTPTVNDLACFIQTCR